MDHTKFTMDSQHIGNTSLIPVDGIYVKCEFENPTGSVKDRSISQQVKTLIQRGIKKMVISSSGNAAISAAHFCSSAGIQLTVFVSPTINTGKLERLQNSGCTIISTKRPISGAVKYAREHGSYNLRQSKDDLALVGYEAIASELFEQLSLIDAVFIPASSGTTFEGIARGFEKKGKVPALHVVQTESVHPIAGLFDFEFTPRKKSLADGIVARLTDRAQEIVAYVKKTNGSGWIISDEQMELCHKKLLENGIKSSYEGAAAMAAIGKAKKKGFHYQNPVCILTGKDYSI